MNESEYQKGLNRGKRGSSSAHSLLDELNLFDGDTTKKSREDGYRVGTSAKAHADLISGSQNQTHDKHDYTYSSGSTGDYDLGDKFLTGIMMLFFGGGGVIGCFYGISSGFVAHGVGGAILYGVIGAVVGVALGGIAYVASMWVLAIAGIALVFWLFSLLWDLGKP